MSRSEASITAIPDPTPELRPLDTIDTMEDLRVQIDTLDRALIDLLALRAQHIDRAVVIKSRIGLDARIPARVEDVVRKACARAETVGLDRGLVEYLWRGMIEFFIAHEDAKLRQKDLK